MHTEGLKASQILRQVEDWIEGTVAALPAARAREEGPRAGP
jgi:hypothetical protein